MCWRSEWQCKRRRRGRGERTRKTNTENWKEETLIRYAFECTENEKREKKKSVQPAQCSRKIKILLFCSLCRDNIEAVLYIDGKARKTTVDRRTKSHTHTHEVWTFNNLEISFISYPRLSLDCFGFFLRWCCCSAHSFRLTFIGLRFLLCYFSLSHGRTRETHMVSCAPHCSALYLFDVGMKGRVTAVVHPPIHRATAQVRRILFV